MNQGIYGLSGTSVTPVQGPFSGTADARRMLSVWALLLGGGGGGSAGVAARAGPGGGGGGVLEIASLGVFLQTAYTVSIGAGAAAAAVGNSTQFGAMAAVGGGQAFNTGGAVPVYAATGGGSFSASRWPTIVPSQGFSGGIAISPFNSTGGGGGAGAQGSDATSSACGKGGDGKASAISGVSVQYGAGGGAGAYVGTASAGSGGASGGGSGSSAVASAGTAGTANTGGGGGGGAANGSTFSSGAAGGSGIVILRWNASQAVATLSAGLTATRATVGTDTVLTITAGTGTVTWS